MYFANVKVPVETLALKDINVDLGHSLKDFDSIRKKKKKKDSDFFLEYYASTQEKQVKPCVNSHRIVKYLEKAG